MRNIIKLLSAFSFVIIASGCMNLQKNIKERVQIIPPSERHTKYYQKNFKRMLKRISDPEQKKTADKRKFDKWKKYEDEYISFLYPDDPNIVLEIKSSKDRIPIMGGAVGTTENTFFKSYRLALGKFTYCLIMLEETDSFDDGICFCGAIAYQKYIYQDGSLFRFDLMENGDIKKIQALSDKYRVVVFEWPHLPIQQSVYFDFGSSIRFKKPANKKELIAKILKKYGGIGFLEKGMNKQEVLTLMGTPTKDIDSKLIYETTEDRYRDTITIEFDEKGQFEGFKDAWAKTVSLPPKHGSIDWMLEKVKLNNNWTKVSEQEEDDFFDEEEKDYDLGLLTKKEAEFMISEFKRLTPTASDEDWDSLCVIVYDLFQRHGYEDDSILPFLKKRYLKGTPSHSASWILNEYEAEGREELFAGLVKKIYDHGLKNIDDDEPGLDFFELHNLFCFIGRDSKVGHKLIIEGCQHPNSNVRDEAYSFADYLPDEQAIKFYRIGLKDKNKEIRERCAKAFSEEVGTVDDIQRLKEVLPKEKEKKIQKLLDAAIKRLSMTKPDRKKP